MNKIFYSTAVLFLFLIGSVSAQFADPAVSGAFFGPNEIEVGQTATLNISFSNSGSTAIPVNSIELTISTADNFYTSDGTTPPSGAGASLFTWNYLGSDVWRGENTSEVPAFGGGAILLPVTGTAVTAGFETTNINVQPTANFTAFLTDAPGNNNLQPELKINVAQSPSATINDVTVNEDAGNAVLTVSLSSAPSSPVSIDFSTAPGTAGTGDFTSVASTLNIPAGQTSGTIVVPITDDNDDEPNETFNVNLSNPSGLIIADGTGVVTILDNDDPAPLPNLSINDVSVVEGAGNASLTVSLSAPSTDPVTVNFATAPGTAGAGDFTSVASTLNIPAGQTSGTIVVPITDDNDDEPNEIFSVNLSNPVGANIADGTGIVTIFDNDDPAPLPNLSINDVSVNEGAGNASLTVSLSAPSTDPVTVNFATAPGTAGTGDFTSVASTLNIPAGQTSGTIVVPITDDNDDEPNEIFSVNLSNPVGANIADGTGIVTIFDNDDPVPTPTFSINDVTVDENAGNAILTVSLPNAPVAPVSVDFATATGTAGTADFTATTGTLNFNAGQTTATIIVPITDDTDIESAEIFNVILSNPSNGTIADGIGQVTINDNDVATPDCSDIVISQDANGITVSGLDGAPISSLKVFTSNFAQELFSCFADCSATETVPLSAGTYIVSVRYYTSGYQLICEEQQNVTIGGGDPCANAGGDSDGDGVCNNDDCRPFDAFYPATPGTLCDDGDANTTNDVVTADGCGCAGMVVSVPMVNINDVTVDENAVTANLTVSLSMIPALPVTVQFTTADGSADGSDYTTSSGQVTIPAGQLTANIAVPITDDNVSEPTESFNVNLTSATGANIGDGTGVVMILDNDTGGGPDCSNISITSGNGTITIAGLDGAPLSSAKIFSSDWSQTLLNCFGDCGATETVNVPAGTYYVYAYYYTAGYQQICEVSETVTIGGGSPCANAGGDSDGDGVCNNDDCRPFDAFYPATPGIACNDNNPNTIDDVVTADGCGCAGTPLGGGCDNYTSGGQIGFGSACTSSIDYCPNSSGTVPVINNCVSPVGGSGNVETIWFQSTTSCSIPTSNAADILAGLDPHWSLFSNANTLSISTAGITESTCFLRCVRRLGCDTYIESNIISVNVPANCGGGSPDCADISITSDNGTITIAGLDGAPLSSAKIFSSDWSQTLLNCFGDCGATETVNVPAGTYYVYAYYYTAGYQQICEVSETVTVGGGDPCAGLGGDSDGDGVCDNLDCRPIDPFYPATPGIACNDGNPNTTNDVVTPDGCGCEGIPVNSCDNFSYAGVIGFGNSCISNINYCPNSGTVSLSNCASPSGGSGSMDVVWLQSTTSCDYPTADPMTGTDPHWSVLSNSNDLDLDLANVTENTCYLRCIRRSGCDTYIESNIITLTVPANCGNGTPDCNDISIYVNNGNIVASGLDGAPATSVKIFNSSWQQVHKCFDNCGGNTAFFPVVPGTYYVYVTYYDENYFVVCEEYQEVYVPVNLAGTGGEDLQLKAVKYFEHTEVIWMHDKGHLVEEYVVENSLDGITFGELTFQASKMTEKKEVYNDFDLSPATGDNYYRIKMIGTDGTIGYSNIVKVNFADLIDFSIFPNPANDFTNLNIETVVGRKDVTITIFNNLGVAVKQFEVEEIYSKYQQLDIRELNEGHYIVWLQVPGHKPVAKTLVIGKI